MPLISHGSLASFSAVASGAAADAGLAGVLPCAVLREAARSYQPVPLEFAPSQSPLRLAITSLSLAAPVRAMLPRLPERDAPLHVLVWYWDLSGRSPAVVPAGEVDAKRWQLDLDGTGGRFLAEQALTMLPTSTVVGGLAVRVLLWQAGPDLTPVALAGAISDAMRHARLTDTLATVAGSGSRTVTAVSMVAEAAAALGPEVAPTLRLLCPDYLDFFEGFFPAAGLVGGVQAFHGYHSGLSLSWDAGSDVGAWQGRP